MFPDAGKRRGFTLVELLVTVGIVALLLAILLPAVTRAGANARRVQCESNLHQLAIAFFAYAQTYRGKFPPNLTTPAPGQQWYDDDRIGRYLPATRPPVPSGKPGGGVYICPEDPLPSYLSYSMNIWTSSAVDSSVSAQMPVMGTLWHVGKPYASKMILLAETYSQSGSPTVGWYAPATVGVYGDSAGEKFGGGAGIAPPVYAKRWGNVVSELDYMRHRLPGTNAISTQPRGRLNIAYADGHVASKSDTDLVTRAGTSTGDTYWSPIDWGGG